MWFRGVLSLVIVLMSVLSQVFVSRFDSQIDMALFGASNLGEAERAAALTAGLFALTTTFIMAMGILTIFYALDSLYAERKDKSIPVLALAAGDRHRNGAIKAGDRHSGHSGVHVGGGRGHSHSRVPGVIDLDRNARSERVDASVATRAVFRHLVGNVHHPRCAGNLDIAVPLAGSCLCRPSQSDRHSCSRSCR